MGTDKTADQYTHRAKMTKKDTRIQNGEGQTTKLGKEGVPGGFFKTRWMQC